MSAYKEFEGKTLDEAIGEALAYYDTTRDKLEIEILNDAKGGIFGLVGAKKARIRASMVKQPASVLEGLGTAGDGSKRGRKQRQEPILAAERALEKAANAAGRASLPREEAGAEQQTAAEHAPQAVPQASAVESVEATAAGNGRESRARDRDGRTDRPERPERTDRPTRKERVRDGRRDASPGTAAESGGDHAPRERGNRDSRGRAKANGRDNALGMDGEIADLEAENLRRVPIAELDGAELEAVAREVVTRLTTPILGEASIGITLAEDRVRVTISDIETPGLLIGRDGQTLASLQYLATRMISAKMKAMLRVQIDAGDYRERQDERLRELAFSLAEKVKAGGRPQVTRPLSSYHRRVIHLALQDDPLVQTHSKGEGEMKRVMVARRKGEREKGPEE